LGLPWQIDAGCFYLTWNLLALPVRRLEDFAQTRDQLAKRKGMGIRPSQNAAWFALIWAGCMGRPAVR
jgi:hypothetical protein